MLFYWVVGAVMVAACIGMLVCAKRMDELACGKLLLFAQLAVALSCAGAIFGRTMQNRHPELDVISRDAAYARAADQRLGQWLAEHFPDSCPLVIVDDPVRAAGRIEDLKAGLGQVLSVEAVETLDLADLAQPDAPPAADQPSPDGVKGGSGVRERMGARHFNALLEKYPYTKLIVSFVGLPADLTMMKWWQMKPAERPRFVLPLGAAVPPDRLRGLVADGSIAGLVTVSPGAVFDQSPLPAGLEQVFARRYLLVTPENAAQLEAEHGTRVFPKTR